MALQASGPISIADIAGVAAKSLSNVDIAGLIPVFPEITTPAAPHGMDEFYSQNSSGNVKYVDLVQYSAGGGIYDCNGQYFSSDSTELYIRVYANVSNVWPYNPYNEITNDVDIVVTVGDYYGYYGSAGGVYNRIANSAYNSISVYMLNEQESGCSTAHQTYIESVVVNGVTFEYNPGKYNNFVYNRPNNA